MRRGGSRKPPSMRTDAVLFRPPLCPVHGARRSEGAEVKIGKVEARHSHVDELAARAVQSNQDEVWRGFVARVGAALGGRGLGGDGRHKEGDVHRRPRFAHAARQ